MLHREKHHKAAERQMVGVAEGQNSHCVENHENKPESQNASLYQPNRVRCRKPERREGVHYAVAVVPIVGIDGQAAFGEWCEEKSWCKLQREKDEAEKSKRRKQNSHDTLQRRRCPSAVLPQASDNSDKFPGDAERRETIRTHRWRARCEARPNRNDCEIQKESGDVIEMPLAPNLMKAQRIEQ